MPQRKLRREILLTLSIKLIILGGLWYVCFSNPIDESLSPADLAAHLFNNNLT